MPDKKPEDCRSELAMRPLLYTDTICGKQILRDDMWAVTTEELNALTNCAKEARREWKPIDTAPKGGTSVLVCVGNYDERGDIGAHPTTARYETFPPNAPGKASWRCLHGHKLWPTHWMPMPEAPRAAESKEKEVEG